MDAEKAFLQNEICECNLSVKQFGVHVTRLKWINWSNRALGVQCDQMAKLFFNIWQFTTLKNCPIAFNICQSWFIIFPKCFNKPSKSYKNTFLFYDKVVKIAKSGHSDFAVIFTRWWRPAVPQKWWTHNKNEWMPSNTKCISMRQEGIHGVLCQSPQRKFSQTTFPE